MKKLRTVATIDTETGVAGVSRNAMTQSLYYQLHFHAERGRWPTWSDAMAHCTPETKRTWRVYLVQVMRARGIEVSQDLAEAEP